MQDRCSRVFFVLLVAVVAVCLAGGPVIGATPKATIIRDNYGVPHVYSDSLEGLFFGFGYAAAQDRLFQMEMFRRTFWGRLSEILGEKLLPFDQGNRRDNLTLGEVKKQIESLRPDLQLAIQSYAAGINAYISEALTDPSNKILFCQRRRRYCLLPPGAPSHQAGRLRHQIACPRHR